MRIDVVTIFPDYLRPLELSLPGKARDSGLLDLRVHDLRDWTHDRHRTVDDTPYGGGAGMVMKPEPWGEALDAVVDGLDHRWPGHARRTHPGGRALPPERRRRPRHARAPGVRLRPLRGHRPAGDRRRPRPDGGPRGLARRLRAQRRRGGRARDGRGRGAAAARVHGQRRVARGGVARRRRGLLEYPVYTKPPSWRGHDVPDVLLSGDHARIEAWRRDQSRRRTAERRPDLLAPSAVGDLVIRPVRPGDAGELLTLQRACWVQEQQANPDVPIDALTESYDDVRAWIGEGTVLVAHRAGRLVGAVRGRLARRVLGHRAADGRPRPAGRGAGPGAAGADRGRRSGGARPASSCSPARAACATSGCTRRRATGSAGSAARAWSG